MARPTKDWYRSQAKSQYEEEGTLEIDEGATVSLSDDKGAYVQAWVWVDDPSEKEYRYSDWEYEVANGDTKLGYDEWVQHRIEADRE